MSFEEAGNEEKPPHKNIIGLNPGHVLYALAILGGISGWGLAGYQESERRWQDSQTQWTQTTTRTAGEIELFKQRLTADEAIVQELRENVRTTTTELRESLRVTTTESRQALAKIVDLMAEMKADIRGVIAAAAASQGRAK